MHRTGTARTSGALWHSSCQFATQDKEGDDDASQLAILAMPNQTTRTVIREPY